MTQISGAQIIQKELTTILQGHPAFESAQFTDIDGLYSSLKTTLFNPSHSPINKQLPILFELLITLDRHAKNDSRWNIKSVDLLG